ncbi:MAG TPA: antibiotic biosynthesis monooxygenase [Thermoanaerobaculia bacterium]
MNRTSRRRIVAGAFSIVAAAAIFAASAPQPTAAKGTKIARIFRGRVLTARADEYEQYIATGIEKILATPGNQGATILRRAEGDQTEFLVVSYWESVNAVKRFAGEDYQKPVLLPRDREFLTAEPSVSHFEVKREVRRP